MKTAGFALALLAASTSVAPQALDESGIKAAIAVGKSCGDVPLIRLADAPGDFDVYVESPFARVAEHAAAARQMNVPFEPSNVTRDIAGPEYHVWLQYRLTASRATSVQGVVLQPTVGRDRVVVVPVREGPFQLTARSIPAHGIVTEVRWRQYEWAFDRVPDGEFEVVVKTTAGSQRYKVTARDRQRKMRVCT